MLQLECLGAKEGDCMILHHGDTRVLFDGGAYSQVHLLQVCQLLLSADIAVGVARFEDDDFMLEQAA